LNPDATPHLVLSPSRICLAIHTPARAEANGMYRPRRFQHSGRASRPCESCNRHTARRPCHYRLKTRLPGPNAKRIFAGRNGATVRASGYGLLVRACPKVRNRAFVGNFVERIGRFAGFSTQALSGHERGSNVPPGASDHYHRKVRERTGGYVRSSAEHQPQRLRRGMYLGSIHHLEHSGACGWSFGHSRDPWECRDAPRRALVLLIDCPSETPQ